MQIVIEVPDGVTIGDLTTVAGALLKASTEFVDWEALHAGRADAINPPGMVLLSIGSQLDTAVRR